MDSIFQVAIIIVAITSTIICTFFTGNVASSKGYDGLIWALGGLLFGPFALIASCGMPDKKLRSYVKALAQKLEAIDTDNLAIVGDGSKQIIKKTNQQIATESRHEELIKKLISTSQIDPKLLQLLDSELLPLLDPKLLKLVNIRNSEIYRSVTLRDDKDKILIKAEQETKNNESKWQVTYQKTLY